VKKTDETEDEDMEMSEEDIEALSHGTTEALISLALTTTTKTTTFIARTATNCNDNNNHNRSCH